MAYTSHGHVIPGTVTGLSLAGRVHRCGGITGCERCRREAALLHDVSSDEAEKQAKKVLTDFIHLNRVNSGWKKQNITLHVAEMDKTSRGWIALLFIDHFSGEYDGKSYKMIHDNVRRETHIHEYTLTRSRTVSD